jgi:peptidoglycan/LPS O-acetylase OafA/YrhL
MYVFHMPIHLLVGLPLLARFAGIEADKGTPSPTFAFAYFVAATALTYLVALVSYHLLEKHFLALKRRVEPRLPTS